MNSHLSFWKRICFAAFFFSAFCSYAQSGIKIRYYDGTEQQFNVAETGKLYFSGENLVILQHETASEVTLPTSIIRKITFAEYTLATASVGENKGSLKLYPNPASDYVTISGLKQKSLLKIYALSGQMVLSQTYIPDSQLDVGRLKSGIYLVQIDNVTFKLIRK